MTAYVYILSNTKRGVMYVGVTTHMSRRLSEHRGGIVPGFAGKHGLIVLVHLEQYDSMLEARARERAVKRWRRDWKFKLIEETNPEWDDLADRL